MSWRTILLTTLVIVLCAVFIANPGFPAIAFNASSTSFFTRQDVNYLNGTSTSASFKLLNSGASTANGTSVSTSFGVLSGPVYGFYQAVKPTYTQIHYHWRNDDGTEVTATQAANEDTGLANLAKSTVKRLRMEISNTGGTVYGLTAQQLRIEYALISGTCASSTYTDVGAVAGDWDMGASQLTEAGDTTNVSTASGGTTDANNTFLTPNGGQRETTSQTGALTISSNQFVEAEYAIQALAAATAGGTYCFRVTNAGATSSFAYSVYATTTIASGANALPTVSAVSLNHGNAITVTANATTSFDINYTITDSDGCADIVTNRATSTVFRSGTSATCAVPSPTTSNLSCYLFVTRATSTCSGNSINATDTVQIYYFAQATDASSSFASDNWTAYALAVDASNATGSATSTAVELNTLTAIDVTPTTTNYGSVNAGSNTGSSNQTETIKNTGNSSSTLKVSATALALGGVSIATSSQHYATSTFTFGGAEQAISDVLTAVSGFFLTSPTSTTAVNGLTFWGVSIPSGNATGTYTGTNTFTSVFAP